MKTVVSCVLTDSLCCPGQQHRLVGEPPILCVKEQWGVLMMAHVWAQSVGLCLSLCSDNTVVLTVALQ